MKTLSLPPTKVDSVRIRGRANGDIPAIVRGFSPSCARFTGVDAMGRKTVYTRNASGWSFVETSPGKRFAGKVANLTRFAFWVSRLSK